MSEQTGDTPTDLRGAMEEFKRRAAERAENATLDDANAETTEETAEGADTGEESEELEATETAGDGESGTAESEPTGSGEDDTDGAPADTPTEDEFPTTLDALAEAVGAGADDLLSVTTKVTIDGEEKELPIKEALAALANAPSADLEAERATLAQERTALDAERAETKQQAEQLQTLLANMDQLLPQEQEPDFDRILEEEGEAAYVRAMAAWQKQGKAREDVAKKWSDFNAEQQTKQTAEMQTLAVQENAKFRVANKLADDKVYETEMVRTMAYLRSKGFTDAEIGQTIDSRIWTVALEATKFNSVKQKAPETKRRLKKLPKVGAGTGEGKRTATSERHAKLRNRVMQTGSIHDAVRFMKAKQQK